MGSGKKRETVTNVSSNVPRYVEEESKNLYNQAKASTNKPAHERIYQGDRVASFTPLQQQAIRGAGESYGKYEGEANDVTRMLREQYNKNPERVGTSNNPQNIQFNRFTGSAPNTLFNEYYEKMYNPALNELNRAHDRARTMHERQNLFGNKRMSSNFALGQRGLEEARLNQLEQLGANIFGQAMNTFQTEEGRNLASQQAQAGINEQDLARRLNADLANQTAGMQNKQLNMQAANNIMNNILSKYGMNAQDLERLMTIGTHEQLQNQAQIDATMQKFNEMNNYDRLELEWLAKMLAVNSGGETTSTTSTTRPKPSPWLRAAAVVSPMASNYLSTEPK